jgi:O-antigen/teichoic acid export membrane protein
MSSTITSAKNKRIASNTLLLFLRMLVITIINLYSVRLILKGLGKEDYGLYNAIAGVVTATGFISSVLALSIQRFFSYALGKKDEQRLSDIFSTSLNIIVAFSLIILLILETIGLWFVCNKMTIPTNRLNAVIFLYEFSIFSFILSFIQVPYLGAVFSHEDMGIYAVISTIECFLKLLLAIFLGLFLYDHLIIYGAGLFIIALFILASYLLICRNKYKECIYHKTHNKKLYKEILSFGGWATFGSLASTGMVQGNTILINIFFGPLVNVAFGIAQQVSVAFNSLCNNMVIPLRPAMIKAYAEKNYSYLNELFSLSNKFLLYTLSAIAIPLIFEMDFILKVWLGYSNSDNTLFCQLMVVHVVILAMHNPVTIIIHATGHIREYHLHVESLTLLSLPLTWLMFHLGVQAYFAFIIMISLCILSHCVRLYYLKKFYESFCFIDYLKRIMAKGCMIISLALCCSYFLTKEICDNKIEFIVISLSMPIIIFATAYVIGISHKEKEVLKQTIHSYAKIKK